ncbi:uncharacterized protein N7511_001127 [Penicillium nucicola]|uniref:uncharacterized protein n=1 Tax=Penicillium nucicola TaxID=1850975 RepID=UPI002544DC7A|nr:uncharacterized protein N7511_001127 [Penicillium nucicola]KAJ5776116.1 hypothetical protein N7511_001127 [Penicillium nucicola]
MPKTIRTSGILRRCAAAAALATGPDKSNHIAIAAVIDTDNTRSTKSTQYMFPTIETTALDRATFDASS